MLWMCVIGSSIPISNMPFKFILIPISIERKSLKKTTEKRIILVSHISITKNVEFAFKR
jgi:hypothetical protein